VPSQVSESANIFQLLNSRGVAQYLRDYSPCTPIPEQPAEELSLNKILDGKTRKIAARMFFEVLVSFITFPSIEMNFNYGSYLCLQCQCWSE
jgi:hypothetical protein